MKFQNTMDKRKISEDVKSSQKEKKKVKYKNSEVRIVSDF